MKTMSAKILAFCAVLAFAPMLMAPTGGYPSKPRFNSVGVGRAASATTGTIVMKNPSATGSSSVNFESGAFANPQVVGAVGLATAIINDSAVGDMAIRVPSGAIRFSVDGGSSSKAFVDSNGLTVLGGTSTRLWTQSSGGVLAGFCMASGASACTSGDAVSEANLRLGSGTARITDGSGGTVAASIITSTGVITFPNDSYARVKRAVAAQNVTCVVSSAIGISAGTRTGTGNCTYVISAVKSSQPLCTANAVDPSNAVFVNVIMDASNVVRVNTRNSAGVMTDFAVLLVCVD